MVGKPAHGSAGGHRRHARREGSGRNARRGRACRRRRGASRATGVRSSRRAAPAARRSPSRESGASKRAREVVERKHEMRLHPAALARARRPPPTRSARRASSIIASATQRSGGTGFQRSPWTHATTNSSDAASARSARPRSSKGRVAAQRPRSAPGQHHASVACQWRSRSKPAGPWRGAPWRKRRKVREARRPPRGSGTSPGSQPASSSTPSAASRLLLGHEHVEVVHRPHAQPVVREHRQGSALEHDDLDAGTAGARRPRAGWRAASPGSRTRIAAGCPRRCCDHWFAMPSCSNRCATSGRRRNEPPSTSSKPVAAAHSEKDGFGPDAVTERGVEDQLLERRRPPAAGHRGGGDRGHRRGWWSCRRRRPWRGVDPATPSALGRCPPVPRGVGIRCSSRGSPAGHDAVGPPDAASCSERPVVPVEELPHAYVLTFRADPVDEVGPQRAERSRTIPRARRLVTSRSHDADSSSGLTNCSTPPNTRSRRRIGREDGDLARQLVAFPEVVGIEQGDELACRFADARVAGRADPAVRRSQRTRTDAPKRRATRRGRVGRAVVDDDHLHRAMGLLDARCGSTPRTYRSASNAGITTLTVGVSWACSESVRHSARSPVIPAARRRSSERFNTPRMLGSDTFELPGHVRAVEAVDEGDVGQG